MAGYSSSGTAKKLGIKPGGALFLLRPPEQWSISDLPDGVEVARRVDGRSLDASSPDAVVIAFFRSASEIESSIEALGASIFPAGALWVAWPRRAGGHESDITDNTIRSHALPLGLVDNKVAAIDDDWSGLRVVWRVERRSMPMGS
jgi:hypothetical protein